MGTVKQKFQKDLNSGTVALVLLAILDRAVEPLYGYRIAKELSERSSGPAVMKQGTLYPVLRSMERNGWLGSEVEPSVSGPPRRYYTITDEGRRVLQVWAEVWTATRDFVDRVLDEGRGEQGATNS